MNVIGVRQAPDNLHAKSAEEDAIKLYCASRGWPNKGLEFQNSLGEAMARGSIIVARTFATLFPNPSVVVSLLSTALADGKQVHTCDAGDLTAILPLLRTLCAAWAPLEGKIASLNGQLNTQAEEFAAITNEAVVEAVRRCTEMQLGRILEDAKSKARERVENPPNLDEIAEAATERALAFRR